MVFSRATFDINKNVSQINLSSYLSRLRKKKHMHSFVVQICVRH
jgi:hypothetical protein